MANGKRGLGPSVDAMAFDLLADAFLDVTGVLMRIDPAATKDLLRLIQERMVVSTNDQAEGSASAEVRQVLDRAMWKAGTTIRAAEAALSEKVPVQ